LKTIIELIQEVRSTLRCITAQQAMAEVNNNSGLLLDVRETSEVSEKQTPSSVNIPRGVLEMKMLASYPNADLPIYIHCATGARASLAAEQLQRVGYQHVTVITSDLETVCNSQSA
jgi:rhodanese-related sulfurtransferase